MTKQPRILLKYPSTALVQDPVLCTSGADLVVKLRYDEAGQSVFTTIQFVRQRAFRKRSEAYCTPWHIEGVYDHISEVFESSWVEELRSAAAPERRDSWRLNHFIVYIDSFGCLEVVAESVNVEEKPE